MSSYLSILGRVSYTFPERARRHIRPNLSPLAIFSIFLSHITTLGHVDDDLAELRPRSHVLVSRLNLVEAEPSC
jgi:hypothetical protein